MAMQYSDPNRQHFSREDFLPLDKNNQDAEKITRESLTSWQDIWYRLNQNKLAMFGFWLLILITLFAIFGPLITKYDHTSNNLEITNQAPSLEHWFGTDDLGRDMFARTWKGAQISLFVGVVAALIDLAFGVILGGIMGFFGGKIDEVLNRFSEILYAIPYLLVVIMLLVVMGPSLWTIIIAMCITGWINTAWIVRGQIFQIKTQEFVLASRSLGAGQMRILFRHLIPNVMGPVIVCLTLTVPTAIFTEAFLSFLGLGVQAPAASWGTMINDALSAWYVYPWRMMFPAVLISLTMFAFNVFGDGLSDAFDPKMKR